MFTEKSIQALIRLYVTNLLFLPYLIRYYNNDIDDFSVHVHSFSIALTMCFNISKFV